MFCPITSCWHLQSLHSYDERWYLCTVTYIREYLNVSKICPHSILFLSATSQNEFSNRAIVYFLFGICIKNHSINVISKYSIHQNYKRQPVDLHGYKLNLSFSCNTLIHSIIIGAHSIVPFPIKFLQNSRYGASKHSNNPQSECKKSDDELA